MQPKPRDYITNPPTIELVIPTIGRKNITEAFGSARLAGFSCITLVNDGLPEKMLSQEFLAVAKHADKVLNLGRNWGMYSRPDPETGLVPDKYVNAKHYVNIPFNVAAYLSKCDFVMCIGDDDQVVEDASKILQSWIVNHPHIDVWIPGVQYNDHMVQKQRPVYDEHGNITYETVYEPHQACMSGKEHGVAPGNVTHPCIRREVFGTHPMTCRNVENQDYQDFYHMEELDKAGFKFGWTESVCVLIRPNLDGFSGHGTTT